MFLSDKIIQKIVYYYLFVIKSRHEKKYFFAYY